MSPEMEEALYQAVGEKIRRVRVARPDKMSQAALAKKLGKSRASVVNIEAGRQHAPLSLLWNIASQLEVELTALMPSAAELQPVPQTVEIPLEFREQLQTIFAGDANTEKTVSAVIAQFMHQLQKSQAPAHGSSRKKSR
jgi:transcriptional regulator with XRE-family HTH domain